MALVIQSGIQISGTTLTTLHTKTNYTSTSSRNTYNTAEVFITL